MISTATLAAMLSVSIFTIVGPIIVLTIWFIKRKTKLMPALAGAIIFLVFARVLEMIPHILFLSTDNPISQILTSNPLLYALYGGLIAGIFEETGRLTAFHFLLKKNSGKEMSVTYGIGHGGFESMTIVGFGFIQYFSIALMINNGSMDSMIAAATGENLTSLQTAASLVSSMTVTTCILCIIERTYAFIFHIALSVLVYHSIAIPGKKWLFPVAILLHAGLDFFAGLYQTGILSLPITEGIGIIFTGLVALFAFRIYTQKETSENGS